jgi:AraC-like DNA-binding protein/quercetin dioxygenase-like cupin family protein
MRKYFKHKIKSLLIVNKIITIHRIELDELFRTDNEKHDFWEIVFLYKGNLTCVANDKFIPLAEGDIIFHQPNEIHSFSVTSKKQADVLVISFECLSEAMRFFSGKKVRLNARQRQFLEEIARIAKHTYDITFYNTDTEYMKLLDHPTLGGEQLIKNYFETLLIDVMRSQTETEDGNFVFLKEREKNSKLAEDIISVLNESLYTTLTIDDIAQKMSYSKAYVFRQFKSATGESIMNYYINLKVKEAKKLLLESNLSIKEISEKLCFDTPNYFTKTFKKVTNKTPTEYKKHAKF